MDCRRSRRLLATLACLGSLGGLVACDGDETSSGTTDAPTAPTTVPPEPEISLPEDPGQPFLSVDGGLFVTAGGRVYRRTPERPGAEDLRGHGFAQRAAAPPVPPAPAAWEVAELTEDGLDAVVERMDELGFLAPPPDYGDYIVSDTATFELTVTLQGIEYTHELFEPEEHLGERGSDAARDRLADLRAFLDDIDDELDGEIGPFEPYLPARWRVESNSGRWDDGEPWPFSEQPTDGCTAFERDAPTASGVDRASGWYSLADGSTVDVAALLPWELC